MRARLALALLNLALPLAACSDDEPPAALPPVATAAAAPAPSDASPSDASPSPAPVPARPSSPASRSPRPTGEGGAAADEGVVYGKITSATAEGFTYDKVTYDETSCNAVQGDDNLDYDVKTASCFTNDNPRLRTVRFGPGARVEVQNDGQEGPDTYPPTQLVDLLGDQAKIDTPAAYRVWEITVRGGVAVRVTTFQVVGA